ncbi:MAG: hypothetical protein IKS20_11650 [Victivallales bacterium]|nr:hypothetical protein [Victivallales bacterium]
MKIKWNRRCSAYSVILVLLALLAFWIWHEPPYLKELKKVESVESDLEEPQAVMDELLQAIASKERGKLMEIMLIKDGTEFQRLFGTILDDAGFLPLELKGIGRLVHSHKHDNISFYYQSANKKNYQFGFVRNSTGAYKLRSISSFKNLPEKAKEI